MNYFAFILSGISSILITATYEKIIRCMKEEFLAFGYEKASLNRVSARVGITTAGLYRHFRNKEDLIRKEAEADREYADILNHNSAGTKKDKTGCVLTFRSR